MSPHYPQLLSLFLSLSPFHSIHSSNAKFVFHFSPTRIFLTRASSINWLQLLASESKCARQMPDSRRQQLQLLINDGSEPKRVASQCQLTVGASMQAKVFQIFSHFKLSQYRSHNYTALAGQVLQASSLLGAWREKVDRERLVTDHLIGCPLLARGTNEWMNACQADH